MRVISIKVHFTVVYKALKIYQLHISFTIARGKCLAFTDSKNTSKYMDLVRLTNYWYSRKTLTLILFKTKKKLG